MRITVSLKKIEKFAGPIVVVTDILGFLTEHFIMSLFIFILLLIYVIGVIVVDVIKIWNLNKENKKYIERKRNRIDKIRNYMSEYGEEEKKLQIDDIWRKVEERKRRTEGKKRILKKSIKQYMTICLAMLIIGAGVIGVEGEIVKSNLTEWISHSGEEESETKDGDNNKIEETEVEENPNPDSDDVNGKENSNNDADSEVIHPIETDMLFVLEEPQKPRDPANNDTEEVFYIKDDSVDPIRDVGDHIKSCINRKISIQVELEYDSEITGSNMEVYSEAILAEIEFVGQMERAKEYAKEGNYEKWASAMPSSQTLDYIIDRRKCLWKRGMRDSALAFSMANNYQAYALEYEHQKKDANTMLCLYMDSIKWCELALSMRPDDEKIQKYLRTRYKDIAGSSRISKDYREKAEKVYKAMEAYYGLWDE